jgi:hypothetical protein
MKKPVPKIPVEKRTRETMWHLVRARCTQLTDAVAAARIPFLVALTWSFVWISALYFTGFGYTQTYLARYMKYSALAVDPARKDSFKAYCLNKFFNGDKSYSFAGNAHDYDENWQLAYCRQTALDRHAFAEKAVLESAMVALPAGLGRLHISDFGIMGNAAILFILLWSYYAMRRENHAIKTFVDFDESRRRNASWVPAIFCLEPQDPNLSAEHYAFSYHAVSQRFLFLFSVHTRPLLVATVTLGSVPAIASALNLLSDIASLVTQSDLFEPSVFARFAVEIALFAVVLVVTWKIVCLLVETSVLLNGWQLAVSYVWMNEWDESTDDPASDAEINVAAQTAKRHGADTAK